MPYFGKQLRGLILGHCLVQSEAKAIKKGSTRSQSSSVYPLAHSFLFSQHGFLRLCSRLILTLYLTGFPLYDSIQQLCARMAR